MVLTERQRAPAGPRDEKRPGSVEWCWQTLDLLKIQWQRKDLTDKEFEETLQELRTQEVWKVVPPEQPYGTLNALLQAEIGRTLPEARDDVQGFVVEETSQGERTDLDKLSKSGQARRAQQNGIGIVSQRKLDHLAGHDDKTLLHEVQLGMMSIDAAYNRARGKVPETTFDKLKRAWQQLTDEEKRRFPHEVVTDEQDREKLAKELAMMRETEAWPPSSN
jgi:hypothetical protein